jgi:hypothetical protein
MPMRFLYLSIIVVSAVCVSAIGADAVRLGIECDERNCLRDSGFMRLEHDQIAAVNVVTGQVCCLLYEKPASAQEACIRRACAFTTQPACTAREHSRTFTSVSEAKSFMFGVDIAGLCASVEWNLSRAKTLHLRHITLSNILVIGRTDPTFSAFQYIYRLKILNCSRTAHCRNQQELTASLSTHRVFKRTVWIYCCLPDISVLWNNP